MARAHTLDAWIGAAVAELERRGVEPDPGAVAELLAERLDALRLRAPLGRRLLLRQLLERVVRAGDGSQAGHGRAVAPAPVRGS